VYTSAHIVSGPILKKIVEETSMALNRGRIWLGGLAGGVVWNLWSFCIYHYITGPRYIIAQNAGWFLKTARYPYFPAAWTLLLFIMAIAVAHLYAWARQGLGPGPGTALKVGFLAGFFAGFPDNFAQAEWSAVGRALPFGWMIEMWLGAILAALVAGFLYKE
jgi:hypothetical protein